MRPEWVAVVGGGNVAMEAEMPARREGTEHAKEEGVAFKTLSNPVAILEYGHFLVKGMMAVCYYRLKNAAWRVGTRTVLDTALKYKFITPVSQYSAAILPLLKECDWKTDPPFLERVLYPDFLRPAAEQLEPLTPAELLVILCANRSNQEMVCAS